MKFHSFLASALLLSTAITRAELITGLTVQSGTTNPFNVEPMGPAKAINGEGLPGGVPALFGAHGTSFNQHWWTFPPAVAAQITIDLNANYQINTIHVWNYNEGGVTGRSTKNAEIHVSPDDDPANLVKLVTNGSGTHDNGTGDFLLPQAPGSASYLGFDLDLAGVTNAALLTNVRLVQIKPLDAHGTDGGGVGLAEVQFDGVPAPEEPEKFQLVITPNGANYDFTWESKNGKLYDLVTSPDLSTPVLQWPVHAGNAGIPGTAPSNTLVNVPGDGAKRFFAVIEKDAPPLFAADFEADNGGFTAIGTPNDWAWGTPNSNVLGPPALTLTTGNGGSTKCWATNLGDGSVPSGFINPSANSILRSPNINLTTITGAQLSFAAAVDGTTSDTLQILVKEVGTDDLLVALSPISLPSTAPWASFGPLDLSAADNNNIYLEFRFQGTDSAYIGFYLDDVLVTVK
jgi:hypothetical protein